VISSSNVSTVNKQVFSLIIYIILYYMLRHRRRHAGLSSQFRSTNKCEENDDNMVRRLS